MAELMSKEGNKVQFKVTVPAAEVNSTYQAVWEALSREVRVPGFRPGKAPRKVIEGRVGADYVPMQVRERLYQKHYPQAVRELKLSMVDADIDSDDLKEGQGFTFTVSGETYPEVKLGDWRGLKLESVAPEVTDEVLSQTLSDLQERNATFEAVERAIQAGDQVSIEEQGEEGGAYPIYLDYAEEHVREALLGKNVGDEVEINVPAHQHGDHEHPAETVKVKVTGIQSKKLKELDDEFAKSLSFDSMERLRTDLRAELERRAAQEGENNRREELIDHLVQGMEVDIPQSLITNRRESMLAEIKGDLQRQGVKWREYESFMKEQDKYEEFMENLTKNAETRVKRDLALEKLGEELDVKINNQEFNQAIHMLAQMNGMTGQQLADQLGSNGLNSYYVSLLRDKALLQAVELLTGEKEDKTPEADKAEEAKEETKTEE